MKLNSICTDFFGPWLIPGMSSLFFFVYFSFSSFQYNFPLWSHPGLLQPTEILSPLDSYGALCLYQWFDGKTIWKCIVMHLYNRNVLSKVVISNLKIPVALQSRSLGLARVAIHREHFGGGLSCSDSESPLLPSWDSTIP